MKVIRAEHLGMCFGVRDAIELALKESREGSLTVLGELVHNEAVMEELKRSGVLVAHDLTAIETPTVMITAHGASDKTLAAARGLAPRVIEGTCPLVHLAHRAIRRLVQDGFHPVIIGKHDHVEVRGLTGDLDDFDVLICEEEVETLRERPRFGIAAQTTQPIERVRHLVGLIQERFPKSEVRFVDTVCQPTKQRQSSAIELAQKCEVVIVIGGANSNNTRELVKTCSRYCGRVHHVRNAADLRREWFEGVETVGITAGTSTPDAVIEQVHQWIEHATSASEAQVTSSEILNFKI